jgi:hypothetical protein
MDFDLQGSIISGELFNEMCISNNPIILCDENNKIGYNDTIHTGLNESSLNNTNSYYVYGGIRFVNQNDFINISVPNIAISHYWTIRVPIDAQVHIDTDCYKADKLVCIERKPLKEMSLWTNKSVCKKIIEKEKEFLRFVKCFEETDYLEIMEKQSKMIQYIPQENQSITLKYAAVSRDSNNLQYILNQNLELCRIAIENNYRMVKWAKYIDEELSIYAVSKDGMLLEHVPGDIQTEAIILSAVNENYNSIKFAKVQTEQICKIVFDKNFRSFEYLQYKTDTMILRALNMNGMMLKYVDTSAQTENICDVAINRNIQAIEFAIKQTTDTTIHAVSKDGMLLRFVTNQTQDICDYAVYNNIGAIKYVNIEYQSYEMTTYVLSTSGLMIEYIDNQTVELCEMAFNKNYRSFKFCKLQTDNMILSAVSKDGTLLQFVQDSNKNMEICQIAFDNDMKSIESIPPKYQTEQMSSVVLKYPELLQYISKPSDELIIQAINKNPKIFSSIKGIPTEGMIIAYVVKNGNNLKDVPIELWTDTILCIAVSDEPLVMQHIPIKFHTEELCVIAVSENHRAFEHCKIKTYNVLKALIIKNSQSIRSIDKSDITIELAEIATNDWAYSLEHIPKDIQTRQMILKCVKKMGSMLEYANDDLIDGEIEFEAVNNSQYAIKYVKNQTDEIKQLIMDKGGYYFEWIDNPSSEIRLDACKKNGRNLKHIKNPSYNEITSAIKDNKWIFNQIDDRNKSPLMCLTSIFHEPELYTHSNFKDDDYFNLMAFLVNPDIEKDIDPKALQFITTHEYTNKIFEALNQQPIDKTIDDGFNDYIDMI